MMKFGMNMIKFDITKRFLAGIANWWDKKSRTFHDKDLILYRLAIKKKEEDNSTMNRLSKDSSAMYYYAVVKEIKAEFNCKVVDDEPGDIKIVFPSPAEKSLFILKYC